MQSIWKNVFCHDNGSIWPYWVLLLSLNALLGWGELDPRPCLPQFGWAWMQAASNSWYSLPYAARQFAIDWHISSAAVQFSCQFVLWKLVAWTKKISPPLGTSNCGCRNVVWTDWYMAWRYLFTCKGEPWPWCTGTELHFIQSSTNTMLQNCSV